jgi:hypothetical protein
VLPGLAFYPMNRIMAMGPSADTDFVPLGTRASWAKVVLVLAGLVDFVAVLTGFALYRLTDRAATGLVTVDEIQAAQDRHELVGNIQIGVYLIAAVVFLRWFYRAYANLKGLGAEGRHRSGWAVGAWLIPLVSLVWPKRIAAEIWRASSPENEGASEKSPLVFELWWRAFVISGIVVAIGSRLWTNGETLSMVKTGLLIELGGNILGVLAGMLAYVVVDRISERQRTRATMLAIWRPSPRT